MQLNYDFEFDLATGKSRKESKWKTAPWLWSDLLKRLQETHRTHETLKEYMAATKTRQDEIKDVGGFVGGRLLHGQRKKNTVIHRQVVTLDIDFGPDTWAAWEDFCAMWGNAACLYSTHKHSPDNPRLRLIVPLDRPCLPDEYEAIARYIAGKIDIEIFDITTFQPSRLMYWPSTSVDGEYIFEYQDGKPMKADKILSKYYDWTDTTEWPVSERQDKIIGHSIKKQGDPTEKDGIIGAFCREYTIHEAIDLFLADRYEPTDDENRYTYIEGSTAGGAVVYDDLFIYSHHGTDPISGMCCNAFDMVRFHIFGIKDESAKPDTPSNRLPSQEAMIAFATKDPKVIKRLVSEKAHAAKNVFAGDPVDDEEAGETEELQDEDDTWMERLEVDKKSGACLPTIDNVVLICDNDPKLKGRMALNMFEKRQVALKNLPWRKVKGREDKYLTDTDDASLRHYIEHTYGISSAQKIKDGQDISIRKNRFHPVREYLEALEWDGVPRLSTLLVDYLGAEDSRYLRAVTRKSFVACVARVFRPGCKFDNVLVLVGPQGKGKSTVIDRMGGQWFSDSFGNVTGPSAYEQLQGVWLVEMGELAGLRKAEVDAIKHYISKRVDRYRVAYGRRTEDFPRQCVFFGTTNNKDFLRDPTGGRRFWPVTISINEPELNLWEDLTPETVAQLWAEAVELYDGGEPLHLSAKLEDEAKAIQKGHSEQDSRQGAIVRYLNTLLPDEWPDMSIGDRSQWLMTDPKSPEGFIRKDVVCAAEIWCELFRGQFKEMNNFNTKDIHTIMQNLPGWTSAAGNRKFAHYGRQRAYVRL